VAHTFRDISQIQKAQRQLTNAADFLMRYVAIEIQRLDDDVKFFRYSADRDDFCADEVFYNRHTDPRPRKATREIDADTGGWMNGEDLPQRFQLESLGARVRLLPQPEKLQPAIRIAAGEPEDEEEDTGLTRRPEPWDLPRARVVQMARLDKGDDWGTAFRKNFDLLPPPPRR
jgi:hypothetical protein